MWIRISGRQIDDFETLSTGSVTGWGGWCFRQRWRLLWSRLWSRLWSLLSSLIGRWFTSSSVSPACLQIVCSAILIGKVSGGVVLTKHSRVSFHRSLHLFMPKKLNTPHLLFSGLGAMFHDQILCFLYSGMQKPSFGHIGHDQGQAHVRLCQLYTASLPCHRSRHVEHLQEISCCFKWWDAATTSTIYASVSSYKVIKACFVNCWGCFSGILSPKIPGLTTSWCSISRTVWRYALINYGAFHCWQRYIGHVALGVHPLYGIWLIDSCWSWYGYTHIQLHAATNSCCFQSYGRLLNLHPGSSFWWLHWQHCGGLTGFCVLAVCWYVTY